MLNEVTVRTGESLTLHLKRINRLGERSSIRLRLADPPVLDHEVEDARPPVFRLVRILSRIPSRGRGDDSREHRGFAEAQFARRVTEVCLRSGFNAVGAATEVDRVQIIAEDLVLGLLAVDLDREDRFFSFSPIRRGGFTDVISFDVLLGEGGSALTRSRHHVGEKCTENTLEVDAGVLVESAVLRCDDRFADVVGQG